MRKLKIFMIAAAVILALGLSAQASPAKTDIKVYINGVDFNAGDMWYPVFEDNGVIYIPLYEYTCAALDINKPKFYEAYIQIDKKENVYTSPIMQVDIGRIAKSPTFSTSTSWYAPLRNMFYDKYTPYYDIISEMGSITDAYMLKQEIIRIGELEINNVSEEYPFLTCFDQLYMPLTWDNCVNRMGWSFSFDADKRAVSVGCDGQFKTMDGPGENETFEYINGNIKARINFSSGYSGRVYAGMSPGRSNRLYISVDGGEYREIDYFFTDESGTKEFWDFGSSLQPDFEYLDGILSVNAIVKGGERERINIDVAECKIVSTEEYRHPVNPVYTPANNCYPYIELFDKYIADVSMYNSALFQYGILEESDVIRRAEKRGKLTVDGKAIDFYIFSYDTQAYICCEDLVYYGYDMVWDPETRTTTLTRNENKPWVDYDDQLHDDETEYKIYESDCKIVIDGKEIERGYNIGGYTLIPLYELYGKYVIE